MALYNPEKDNADSVMAHFIKKDYLESFLNGDLFLSHFATYRSLKPDGTGRADVNEGTISLSSAAKTRLFIGQEKEYGKAVPLNECSELTGLTGLVSYKLAETENYHIMSFTSLVISNDLRIEPSLAHGRDFIIIIHDLKEFLVRFKKAILSLGLEHDGDYIEYFDVDDTPTKKAIFTKTSDFKGQREIRLVACGYQGKDQLKLQLGNLKDIVRVYTIDNSSPKVLRYK